MRPAHRSARKQSISLYAHTLDLPWEEKLSYGGALLALGATFLAWFSFGDGNTFNGLQNVTWLIGYSVLILSFLVLVPWITALFNASVPQVFTRQSLHWGITGGLILLLSSIALSVYASFQWIALRSSIHAGPYLAIVGGVLMVAAAFLNRSKGRRQHVHLAHVDRTVAVPDEEIERYLRKDDRVEGDGMYHEDQQGSRPPAIGKSQPDESGRPPAMFDL